MAEGKTIVVDEKPMAKLPYDPADIPESVRKRAEAVNALYSQQPTNGSDGQQQQPSGAPEPPPVPPVEPPPPQVPEPALTPPPASAEPAPPSPVDDDGTDTPANWKRRYARMQGRYDSSQKMIGELQEQMTQMGSELLQRTQPSPQPRHSAPPPQEAPNYLTEQDVQNYGGELIDVTQRAAKHALAPELLEIRRQNEELQRRLADEAKHRMDQQLEMAVPDYREIDRDPRWHRWLLGIDMLSGRVRQQLLNEAKQSAQAPRVISFFNSFKNELVATGHRDPAPYSPQAAPPREAAINLASLATPGRARPATGGDASLPPEKPTYTRAQVKELYAQHHRGAYVGREAEWARLEADMFAAQREGRYR